jgi:hypothetical protein
MARVEHKGAQISRAEDRRSRALPDYRDQDAETDANDCLPQDVRGNMLLPIRRDSLAPLLVSIAETKWAQSPLGQVGQPARRSLAQIKRYGINSRSVSPVAGRRLVRNPSLGIGNRSRRTSKTSVFFACKT